MPDSGWVVYVVHVALGAVLYLDVRRSRRSGWWLIAIWAFRPAALLYVGLRLQDWRAPKANDLSIPHEQG